MGKLVQMFQHVGRVRAGGYHNVWGQKYKSDQIREPVYAKEQPLKHDTGKRHQNVGGEVGGTG